MLSNSAKSPKLALKGANGGKPSRSVGPKAIPSMAKDLALVENIQQAFADLSFDALDAANRTRVSTTDSSMCVGPGPGFVVGGSEAISFVYARGEIKDFGCLIARAEQLLSRITGRIENSAELQKIFVDDCARISLEKLTEAIDSAKTYIAPRSKRELTTDSASKLGLGPHEAA